MRSSILLLLTCAFGLGAPLAAEGEQPLVDRVVIFAPVAVGSLTEKFAEAPVHLATDMARRLAAQVKGVRANYSETLPPSDDPAWSAGTTGATSGADITVLTVIEEYAVKSAPPGVGTTDQLMARVHIRALDAKGEQVWHKLEIALVPNREDPKTRHIGGPQGVVAKAACDRVVGSLAYWLVQTAEAEMARRIQHSGEAPPPPAQLIDIEVDSDPAGAEILVNGVFRGVTPMIVPLPVLPIELRIQRQGFRTWVNTLTPAEGMRLRPGLEGE